MVLKIYQALGKIFFSCIYTPSGAPKDLNSTDAWFDAEEELGCDRQSCKEDKQTGKRDQGDSKKEQNGCSFLNK